MAITKTTYVERVLITLAQDGSLKGAHQESISEIKDGAVVLAQKMEAAEPLDAITLAEILPDHAALIAEIAALNISLSEATAERDALRASQSSASTAPTADTISARQFFHGCALRGLCSEAEALDAVKNGTLPATLEGFVDQLPYDQQFNARMLLSGATTFNRSNPLTAAFGQMAGMTPADLDGFWRFCADL